MASLSELLGEENPDQLKKLLQLRDQLPNPEPHLDDMASKAAREQAYKNMFSKQAAQDAVDMVSVPGKTAADSAKVFQNALGEAPAALAPEAEQAVASAVPAALSKAAPSMMSSALPFMGKLAGAAGLVSNLYGELADPRDATPTPVPGRPGYSFRGSDIVKDPENPQGKDSDILSPAQYRNSTDSPTLYSPALAGLAASQDNKEEPASRAPASVPAGKPPVQAMLDKMNPPPEGPSVSDSIAKLLGKQQDDFSAAQEAASNMRLIGMLGKAADTAGTAIAKVAPHDQSAYNDMIKNAESPMSALKAKSDLTQEGMKSAAAQEELKNLMAKNDAGSDVSKAAREILKHAAAQAGVALDIKDTLSASNAEKILPGIENMANRKLMADSNRVARDVARADKQSKLSDEKTKQYLDALESVRGHKDVQNASEGVRLANSGLHIINQYPDPNKMPSQMVQSLVMEMGKLGSGGVPGHAEVAALTPGTVEYSIRKGLNALTNEPNGAQAGEFIKKVYQPYLEGLKKVNTELLKNRIGKISDTRGLGVDPDKVSYIKNRYLQDLGLEDNSGEGSKAGSKQATKTSKEDDDAISWAKANPTDPRAAKILQLHGM